MTMNLMWRWGRGEEGAPRFSWLGDIETESVGLRRSTGELQGR